MKYFLIIFLTSFPVFLFGQHDFHFQHLTIKDGLPSNHIQCLLKDHRGYLWIGTDDGLSRYDGIQFVNYSHDAKNSTSLINNVIHALAEDHEGNIWIGTDDGVSCFHVSTNYFENFFFAPFFPEYNSESVHSIVTDRQGTIWLMANHVLQKFDPQTRTFSPFPVGSSAFNYYIKGHITHDQKNTLWINGIEGLYAFDIQTNQFQLFPFEADNEHAGGRLVMSLQLDGEVLWITTWGAGLRKFDISLKRFTGTYHYHTNLEHPGNTNIIPAICNQVLPSGDTLRWIGTYGSGLGLFDTRSQRFRFFKPQENDPSAISSVDISSMLVDSQNILWIGTSAGLDRWDKKSKRIQSTVVDISKYWALALFNTVLPDPIEPKIWLGTNFANGLYQYDEHTSEINHFDFDPDPLSGKNNIQEIFADSKNQIWICTEDGLYLFNREHVSFTRIDDTDYSLPHHSFLGIDELRPSVYILTVAELGAVLYDEQADRFQRIYPPDSIMKGQLILASCLDGANTYWMGTRTGAYGYNLTTKEEIHFSKNSSPRHRLLTDAVTAIAGGQGDDIWLGSHEGLSHYDASADSITHYTATDGLVHNVIYNIWVDQAGNIWFGTRNGLGKFNSSRKEFSSFSMEDGLNINKLHGTISQHIDGRILIAVEGGYNHFIPQDLEPDTVHPPLVISTFRLNSQPYNWEDALGEDSTLHFRYFQNDFSIEFAALNFTQSKKNQYAYRLVGYNSEWISAGSDRSASYTNLDEGEYIFEVKGTNQDGLWSRNIARIKIHISPPFWKTYWFFVVCFCLLIAVIFGYIRNRTSELRKQKMFLESTVKSRTLELEEAKDRAEKSEQFKQQFLANMSHEIRTPMNAVLGMTDLVMATPLNPKQSAYLGSIKKSSGNLLRILNDILDLSKIEAGKIGLEIIDFDIRSLAGEIVQLLKATASAKHLALEANIDDVIPQWVMGDPTRLNQVLINLTGNAIKFTDRGSVRLQIQKGEKKDGILFSIVDTGIGISSEKIATIFESFNQAHSSDSRLYGGTGLGLTISSQLVELMGGRIAVESEEGRGSKFSFELDLPAGTGEINNVSQTIDAGILNGMKILVVDDTPDNRIIVVDTLTSKADVHVMEASNGIEALEQLRQHDFDLILMDVQMPLMDGYTATRSIRSQFGAPKSGTPVIGFTASILRGDIDKCIEAGMNDYVPKPFTLNQLILTMAKVTGRDVRYLPNVIIDEHIIEKGNGLNVVDLNYLTEFCEGDETRIHKYKQLFLDQVNVFSTNIQNALSSGQYDRMAGILHSFKTKWKMMGMQEALDLCHTLEVACKEEVPDTDLIQLTIRKLLSQMEMADGELSGERDRS